MGRISKYLMSICGMTTDEKVLLKSMTFLCKMPMTSVRLQCMCCIILLQNVSFFCNWIIFLGSTLVRTLLFAPNVGYLQVMYFLGIAWIPLSV